MHSGEVGCSSDTEELYGTLKSAQNRKQRQAGGWQAIGLDHTLFKGIQKKGFRQPTPIQRKAIPLIIDGKDIVAMSRTGSGKTAAFVIPILQKLKVRDMKGIRALIIEPTRELAIQTFIVVKELGRFTGLRCAVLVGGDRIEEQFQAVHEKPDIVVATPGRLLHVIVEMDFRLSAVQIIVFDEADRLFEMGFAEQLHEVLKRIPENRQTLLFSATLPNSIIAFSKAGLSDPVLVRLDLAEKISDKLSMVFLYCRSDDKLAAFIHLAREVVAGNEQTVVFCATMKHVEYLAAVAEKAGIDCVVLYSQLDCVARNINIQKFRKKECSLLIVTDIAARGVDIPLLDVAINYHFPPKPKLFVHRVGRVARAGRFGKAISLFGADEVPYVVDLFLFLSRPLKFATTDSANKDETLIGIFPDDIIDREVDFLKNVHDNSDELDDLLKKSENAMQKYKKTRPQPSAESVRRAKGEIKATLFKAAVHPFLQQESPEEIVRQSLLRHLHNFKSTTTIFEIQSGSKTLSAAVMKEKRKAHQNYIHSKTDSDKCSDLDQPEITNSTYEPSEDVLKNTFQTVIKSTKFSAVNALIQKPYKERKRKADELLEEKRKHFIAYAPAEANAERGLAVDRDFNTLAKASTIEILADDEVGLYKQEKRKKWDRKLKKFVGDNGDDSKKKIRTEDGTYLPATYKSGRYERWQKKQKLEYQNNDDEETIDARIKQHDFRRRSGNRKRKGRNKTGSKELKAPRSELKTSEQILKQRNKKARIQSYQAYRRQQNLKRKGWTGKGRN
ncbi:DEAD/DEAH box helicase [Loa loa]|uniref:RNA helicase n=1 Tax=Loa loa TaxID=7209 RepID=A0A1I7VD92_LOALO|nr:DEAD/DEAH box helicase [Loa loa]EFO19598.1 DEAD/DEAH box helicase [Loa loa]